MKHRLSRLISCALLAGASSFAVAGPATSGWYLGAGVGQAANKVHGISSLPSEKSRDTSYKLYGGYSFTPNFATELEYIDLGRWRGDHPRGAASVRSSALAMSVLGSAPMGDQFSLFAKLGVATRFTDVQSHRYDGSYKYESKKTTATYLLGAGAQWQFTRSLALRAEYQYLGRAAVDNDEVKIDNSLLSLGLQYKF